MSNAKMADIPARMVVPYVSQLGRILPRDWCIAEWQVVANADGRRTVNINVMQATGQPRYLRFGRNWEADGGTSETSDAEARAAFDEALQKEIERLKGGAA